MDARELSEPLKERILTYYRLKYKSGQMWHHESIFRELPYDMQVCAVLLSKQSINQSIYLMSWGATGTQQTRSSVQ